MTMFYIDDSAERRMEIEYCLLDNIRNNKIDRIILFTDSVRDYHSTNEKLTQVITDGRLTYQKAFEYANIHLFGDICILSNSDIIFDDSLTLFQAVDLTNKFYAITRHNLQPDNSLVFNDANACQDVWVFKSPLKMFPSDFELGRPGCDNRIAWEAINSGLNVLNPCKIIRCKHLHLSNKRNYIQNQPVIPGPYGRVDFGDQL